MKPVTVVIVSLLALSACVSMPPPGQTPFTIPTLAPLTARPVATLPPPATAVPVTAVPATAAPATAAPATAPPPARPTAAPASVAPTTGTIGTRENPYPIGDEFSIGDWTVAIQEVDQDAWEVIQAENQFNASPPPGRQFVMFLVAATYEGAETGNAWIDLRFKIVGSEGNTYGTSMDDYCGVLPDPLNNEGEQFSGSTVEGNECVSVETNQLDGATLSVEAGFLNDERVYIALE